MSKFILSTLLLLLFNGLAAQEKGQAAFKQTKHDFGTIKEDGPKATHVFKFSNKGKTPVRLTHVQASCGCTTPAWSKEPVATNEQGFIKVTYDPMHRPGNFQKTITVKTDGDPSVVVLVIKGDVTPRVKGPEDFYPFEIGNLRFSTNNLYFDKIKHTATKSLDLTIYNQGTEPITVKTQAIKTPAHLTLEFADVTVEPKKTIKASASFDARQQGDWGYTYGDLELVTDDVKEPKKKIYFGATIEEDFTGVGKSLPQVNYPKIEHNFGKIKKNETVTTTFTIANKGVNDLYIRKTKASCGCTTTQPKKELLAPNESTTINVSFYSGDREGEQKKSITVITNDPKNPQQTLWIKANVSN